MSVKSVDIASFTQDAEKYTDCVINIHNNGEIAFEYTWREERLCFLEKNRLIQQASTSFIHLIDKIELHFIVCLEMKDFSTGGYKQAAAPDCGKSITPRDMDSPATRFLI